MARKESAVAHYQAKGHLPSHTSSHFTYQLSPYRVENELRKTCQTAAEAAPTTSWDEAGSTPSELHAPSPPKLRRETGPAHTATVATLQKTRSRDVLRVLYLPPSRCSYQKM